MAYLEFDQQKEILNRIKSALKRRSLVMDPEDEWEEHGPHPPEMRYRVFIGRAYEKLDPRIQCNCTHGVHNCQKHHDGFYVVIYPRAVYCINHSDDWWKPDTEDNIPVLDVRKALVP
jgi:hypothetical protein